MAETFIQTYYLQSNPKGALAFSEGAASEKLKNELSLLEGFSASQESERPAMHYKIIACETDETDQAQCSYQLDIQMDRIRVRRGRLTLRKLGKTWRVTQFVEEPYQDD